MNSSNPPLPPMGWKLLKLGDCVKLINGRAYSQNELLDAGTPVIRIQNLNGGDRWYYSDLTLPEDKYCHDGDLLFAWSASFGPYIWRGDRSIFHYHIWRVIPNELIDKAFAFWLLDWITAKVKEASHGVAMLHMTKAGMEAWLIPIPPIAEQRRIAAILDQADSLRIKRREALAQLDSFKRSIFLELLRAEANIRSHPLADLVQEMHQGINTVTEEIEYQEAGIPIIQSKHITQGYLDLSDARFVNDSTFEKYRKNYQPEFGDVLLCNIGTIGKSIIINKSPPELLIAWNLFLIKFNNNVIDSCYAKYYLDHLFSSHHFDQFMTGGTVKFISKKTLSATPIKTPNIEVQSEFSAKVSTLEGVIRKHRKYLTALDDLFSSLQHRAFQGEL